jgi:hypothetical protein
MQKGAEEESQASTWITSHNPAFHRSYTREKCSPRCIVTSLSTRCDSWSSEHHLRRITVHSSRCLRSNFTSPSRTTCVAAGVMCWLCGQLPLLRQPVGDAQATEGKVHSTRCNAQRTLVQRTLSTGPMLLEAKGVMKPSDPIANGMMGGTARVPIILQAHSSVPSPPRVVTTSIALATELGHSEHSEMLGV